MNDEAAPLGARAKLALSRAELLAEMGYEEAASPAGDDVDLRPLRHAGRRTAALLRDRKATGSSFARWWRGQPLHAGFELAQPFIEHYAQRNPGKLVAYGAGTGALVVVLKPWRLLSAATVAALLVRSIDVTGILANLMNRLAPQSGSDAAGSIS